MTASEIIADLRAMGAQDVRVIFHFLANRAIEARLAEGQRICDVTDVVAWLRELAEAARVTEVLAPAELRTRPKVMGEFVITDPPKEQPRWDRDPHRCEDCFHVHTGRYECTEYLGEGRFCKCSTRVTA
jgi:hypothetical protein